MKKVFISMVAISVLVSNVPISAAESFTRVLNNRMQSLSQSVTDFRALYKKCRQKECSAQEEQKLRSQVQILGGVGTGILIALTVVGVKVFGRSSEQKQSSQPFRLISEETPFMKREREQRFASQVRFGKDESGQSVPWVQQEIERREQEEISKEIRSEEPLQTTVRQERLKKQRQEKEEAVRRARELKEAQRLEREKMEQSQRDQQRVIEEERRVKAEIQKERRLQAHREQDEERKAREKYNQALRTGSTTESFTEWYEREMQQKRRQR